jgi:hypothetical protein
MKWKKIGKLFDPTTHPAFSEFAGYAQSPQALVLKDRVRIYFSIRKIDTNGKFLSHISFVDFDKKLQRIVDIAQQPVIALGALGAFDEHGIFPISPVEHNGKILAYTCGWSRRVSVSVETSTGLAISADQGKTFDKVGVGPVMSSSLHEPFLVGDSFVRVYNNQFHMWYIYGTRWVHFQEEEAPQRVYKIAHATSPDGVAWQREGRAIITDVLGEDECQALPTVLAFSGKYHMIFCYRHALGFRKIKGRGYKLGYAYSDDLIHWTRNDEASGIDLTEGAWDSDMMCYPNLFECDGTVYLLYNGNEFGKYGFGLAVLEER